MAMILSVYADRSDDDRFDDDRSDADRDIVATALNDAKVVLNVGTRPSRGCCGEPGYPQVSRPAPSRDVPRQGLEP